MQAKKSFGQHFLRDHSAIDKIVNALESTKQDVIVEIGPGTGALTDRLVNLDYKELVLVEADTDLIADLQERFPKARIISGDAAMVDFDALTGGKPWIAVGNLPYNAGNAIVMKILTSAKPPKRLVVMLQKEVGDRMMAKPGDMGILSVATQLYADVKRICLVKPGAFVPPPKVDSVVLSLVPKPFDGDREAIIALAKIGFGNRRKQLQHNFVATKTFQPEELKTIFSELKISPSARAQELSLEHWVGLQTRMLR